MEALEYEGIWWLPENPSDQVAGKLRRAEDGRIVLDLIGTLSKPEKIFARAAYPVVLGSVFNSRLGNVVTLRNCWIQNQSTGIPGFSREGYHVSRAYFGSHLVKEEDFVFTGVIVELSGLSPWCFSLTGLKLGSPKLVSENRATWEIAYETPMAITGDLQGATLTLGVNARASETRRRCSIEETPYIEVESATPVADEAIQSRIVYPLQNLLTLATDHPNAVTSIQLILPEREEAVSGRPTHVHVIAPLTFKDPKVASDLTTQDMLFSFENVRDSFPAIASRWLEVSEKYASACNVYFGLQYAPPKFVDMRLQPIIQALTLYYERKVDRGRLLESIPGAKDILARLTEEQRQRLEGLVRGNLLIVTEQALRALLDEHRVAFGPMIQGHQDRFCDQVLNTLLYVQNRDPANAYAASSSEQLYWLTQRLMTLMKIIYLSELGFSESQQTALLGRNRLFCHIRDVVVPQELAAQER